jgi:hypothetical protein
MTKQVTLKDAELHPRGKAIFVRATLDEECSDQETSRTIYFPLSQCEPVGTGEGYFCPEWLARAKAAEAVYTWVSQRGEKGIDHLGGAFFQAHFSGHSFGVDIAAMHKAKDYLARA